MNVIYNEQVFCFDVDRTLVSERRTLSIEGDVPVVNPYTKEFVYVKPHVGHIDLLKEMCGRGRFIIVWSAAGVQWAERVIYTLGLEQYVDQVITKPIAYIDDQPVENWLGKRIFLDPQERT